MEKNLKVTLYSLLGGCLVMGLLVVGSGLQKPRPPRQDAAADGLDKPRGIALDPAGNVYVVDSRHHRVEVRDRNGALVRRFGKSGVGDGQFREPCGIAIDKQGFIYIADTFHTTDPKGGLPWGRIEKFSPEGVFTSSWGRGPAQGDLFGPRDIAVDSAGNVYLSDTGNRRIVKYAANGTFLAKWGKMGKGAGEFDEPFGLAFDKNDLLYVADRLNYRIQVFKADGSYVRQWKVEGWDSGQVNVEPYLAVDKARGLVYVSDPTHQKIHRYDLQGGGHKEFMKDGAGQPFDLPTGLAVTAEGNLMVTSGGKGKVQVLKP